MTVGEKTLLIAGAVGCAGLLVLLAIGGIVAAVALPKLHYSIERAKVGSAGGDIGAFNSALALYQVDVAERRYPYSLAQLIADNSPGWCGPYMATITVDPWGNNYMYHSDGTAYTIVSVHDSAYHKAETIRYCLGSGILETLPL